MPDRGYTHLFTFTVFCLAVVFTSQLIPKRIVYSRVLPEKVTKDWSRLEDTSDYVWVKGALKC